MQPIFKEGDRLFQMIAREGAVTYDLVVVDCTDGTQTAWGGDANSSSVIMEDFSDAQIVAAGGRRAFIDWGRTEAIRRAQLRVASLKPTPPDSNDRVASVAWNVNYNLTANDGHSDLVIPPAPLP